MDFEKLRQQRNRENPFAALVGIEVTQIAPGFAEATLTVRPELLNPVNTAHGGCLYTLADVAANAAATSFGTKAVTVSGEYHYLAAAPNAQTLTAQATCLHGGKTILPVEVEVRTEDGTRVGKSTFTIYRLKKEVIVLD